MLKSDKYPLTHGHEPNATSECCGYVSARLTGCRYTVFFCTMLVWKSWFLARATFFRWLGGLESPLFVFLLFDMRCRDWHVFLILENRFEGGGLLMDDGSPFHSAVDGNKSVLSFSFQCPALVADHFSSDKIVYDHHPCISRIFSMKKPEQNSSINLTHHIWDHPFTIQSLDKCKCTRNITLPSIQIVTSPHNAKVQSEETVVTYSASPLNNDPQKADHWGCVHWRNGPWYC